MGLPVLASLADVLRALGQELGSLEHSACGLQVALVPFGPALAREHRAAETLQDLDLLTQRLAGLAVFLDALAPTLPAAWTVDAASAVRDVPLSDLARRLAGSARAANLLDEAKGENAAGELDVFATDDG